MKKILYPALSLLIGATLASCGDDNEKNLASETYGDAIATLIVPTTSEKPTTAQMVQYTFNFVYNNNAAKFGINGLSYEGQEYTFLAENIPFVYQNYYNGRIQSFSVSSMSSSGGVTANNVTASVATMLNFRPTLLVDMFTVMRQYVISYKVGDLFTAKTFAANGWYFGQTMTSYVYNDQHKEFSTDKPIYNVVLDLKSGSATVSIFNPVFAEEMPPQMANTEMQLEGLKIEYTRNGYRVVGENIVPKVREGALMVPNTHFTFNNFTLVTNADDLRKATLSFKVAGKYDAVANITTDFNRNNQ